VKTFLLVVAVSVMCTATPQFPLQSSAAGGKTSRGWLSDEQCAGGRAAGGIFTSTNPECAKQCVAKGAKIVLIVPDTKEVLAIENQDAAKDHVGDYVEVTGNIETIGKTPSSAKAFHIDTLKMITKGAAMCGIPKKK
jgi:hypothetical protein